MGRVRKPLKPVYEVGGLAVRFVHPVSLRTVRISLGQGSLADARLRDLNAIFLDPSVWRDPPATTDPDIKSKWLIHCDSKGADVPLDKPTLAKLATQAAEIQRLTDLVAAKERELVASKKYIEQILGRKMRVGSWPSLEKACEEWKAKYQGRDDRHMKNVGWMLDKFVAKFKGDTRLDLLEGQEKEIEAWLRGLKGKAGVRGQYRRYVLKFLTESGLSVDRGLIPAPKKSEIRRDRKRIEWLDIGQARAVAEALPDYYSDCWRVQVGLGLRPDELITLKKSDLRGNMLTLSPLKHLTLKTGSRTISVPAKTLAILTSRLKKNDIVFPQPVTIRATDPGGPWASERYFDLRYRTALQAVPGMPFTLDCRTGRRTCGSILLREGHSLEEVAALLGDRIDTVKEHYAAILSGEVKHVATAI